MFVHTRALAHARARMHAHIAQAHVAGLHGQPAQQLAAHWLCLPHLRAGGPAHQVPPGGLTAVRCAWAAFWRGGFASGW